MKTLSDFKRALTLGSKWKTYNHRFNSDFGVREVSKVGSTYVKFFTNRDGEIVESRFDFPKADCIEFDGDSVNIFHPLVKSMICLEG